MSSYQRLICTPYDPSPITALKEFQERFIAENYDVRAILEAAIVKSQSALAAMTPGDEFGNYDFESKLLQKMKEYSLDIDKADLLKQIDILTICEDPYEGLRNVLDIRGIVDTREPFHAKKLDTFEVAKVFGHNYPQTSEIKLVLDHLDSFAGRGEWVFFTVYDKTKPVNYAFAGYTLG